MPLVIVSSVTGLPGVTVVGAAFGTLALMMLALAAVVYLGSVGLRIEPAVLFVGVIALEIFSGNWRYMGVPLGLDRLALLAALFVLVSRRWDARFWTAWRWRPVHLVMAVLVAYGTLSAFGAHTLATSLGLYALLDRLGIVPFLLFALAPVIFGSTRQRNVLLAGLVIVGGYLGLTALLEGLGQAHAVVPSYIHNLSLGIHQGRARGPFLEATADGAALFDCSVAAAVAAVVWTHRRARVAAGLISIICLMGTIFTLTRSVWLGSVIGTVLALASSRRSRRLFVPVAIAGSASVVVLLAAVPGLAREATARAHDQLPVWDRLNSNAAAIGAVRAHPLFGVGWERFIQVAPQYLRQADGYPLTSAHLEVHNVFLAHAAELGLIGFGLFALAFFGGIVGPAIRPLKGDLELWRVGLVAIAGQWIVIASLTPSSAAFPNLILWTWAGIVYAARARHDGSEDQVPHAAAAALTRSA